MKRKIPEEPNLRPDCIWVYKMGEWSQIKTLLPKDKKKREAKISEFSFFDRGYLNGCMPIIKVYSRAVPNTSTHQYLLECKDAYDTEVLEDILIFDLPSFLHFRKNYIG